VDRIVTQQIGAACGYVDVFLVLYNYIKVFWAQPFYQGPCLVVQKRSHCRICYQWPTPVKYCAVFSLQILHSLC